MGLVGALALAGVTARLGPEQTIACRTGSALDRLAQAVMQPLGGGQIDSASATYCAVPSTTAWLMAAVALAATLSIVAVGAARYGRASESSSQA